MRFYRSERSRKLAFRTSVGMRPWILLPVTGALILTPLFLFFVATSPVDDAVVWTFYNNRTYGLNVPQVLCLGLITFGLSCAVSFWVDWRQATDQGRSGAWLWLALVVVTLGLGSAGYSLYLWTQDLKSSLLDAKGLTGDVEHLIDYAYFDRQEGVYKIDEAGLVQRATTVFAPHERSQPKATHDVDWGENEALLERKVAATERIVVGRFVAVEAEQGREVFVEPVQWLKGSPVDGDGPTLHVGDGLLGNGWQRSFTEQDLENALGRSWGALEGIRFLIFWSTAWENRLLPATDARIAQVQKLLP